MRIATPREIKNHEYRVGLTPESVRELVRSGHRVMVETHAGTGIDASDDDYQRAGAVIGDSAAEVFAFGELIVKVKEPLPPERAMLRPGQVLFTYLHLAPDPGQVRELIESGAIAVAYETVTAPQGGLPLLKPMSEVAGRMAVQVAAHYLERPHGGRGVLVSGATGVERAQVLVLGSGVVGSNAAEVAIGMGADVTVMTRVIGGHEEQLKSRLGARLGVLTMDEQTLRRQLSLADAVVGAALIPGAKAPRLVSHQMLGDMKKGSVIVDVSIDQGGCFETSRPTTHGDPVYVAAGIVHYCVTNMPGAVPRTSTYALNHATLPYVREIAEHGVVEALRRNEHLRNGLNICRGHVTQRAVAQELGLAYVDPLQALAQTS